MALHASVCTSLAALAGVVAEGCCSDKALTRGEVLLSCHRCRAAPPPCRVSAMLQGLLLEDALPGGRAPPLAVGHPGLDLEEEEAGGAMMPGCGALPAPSAAHRCLPAGALPSVGRRRSTGGPASPGELADAICFPLAAVVLLPGAQASTAAPALRTGRCTARSRRRTAATCAACTAPACACWKRTRAAASTSAEWQASTRPAAPTTRDPPSERPPPAARGWRAACLWGRRGGSRAGSRTCGPARQPVAAAACRCVPYNRPACSVTRGIEMLLSPPLPLPQDPAAGDALLLWSEWAQR